MARTLNLNQARAKKQEIGDIDRYRNGGVLPTETKQSENLDDLDKYYTSGSVLDETYRRAQEQLDESRRTAKQSAYVAYDTAMKYLPIQNKMNGMAGLGVSESGSIDAYNKLASSMGSIEQTHGADSAALLERYREAAATEKEKEESEIKTAQDKVYAEVMTALQSGIYNNATDIDTYLEAVRGKVSDDQWTSLEYYANVLKNSPENKLIWEENEKQAAADKAEAELNTVKTSDIRFHSNNFRTSLVEGDNFKLTDANGTVYNIESRGEVTDAALLSAMSTVNNGQVFAYGGKIYYKVNGRVYEVGGRGGNNTSQDYTALYNRFYGEQNDVVNTSGEKNEPTYTTTIPATKPEDKEDKRANRLKKAVGDL